MLWELTSDQEFFRQTTAKFLADQVPVDVLRRLRDDAVGYPERYWERGAELGWTSLLVDESHGGGRDPEPPYQARRGVGHRRRSTSQRFQVAISRSAGSRSSARAYAGR